MTTISNFPPKARLASGGKFQSFGKLRIYPEQSRTGQISNWERGFTLIELIIVIGVLSILSVGIIVILNPLSQVQKTNDAKRKSDLSQLQKSLETYYQDNGRYPASSTSNQSCGAISSCPYRIVSADIDNPVRNWGQSFLPYINVLPKDSNQSKRYVYYVPPTSNGQIYYLYASLERSSDLQVCHIGGGECDNVPEANACAGHCNYGVSSPNVTP